jgi:hypothetical protein
VTWFYEKLILSSHHTNTKNGMQQVNIAELIELPQICPCNLGILDFGYKGADNKIAIWLRQSIIQFALEFYMPRDDRTVFMNFIAHSTPKTLNKYVISLCNALFDEDGDSKVIHKPSGPPPSYGSAFGPSGGDAPPTSRGKKKSKASKKKGNSMNITKSKKNSSSKTTKVNIS